VWRRVWPEVRPTWLALVFVSGPLIAGAIGVTLGNDRTAQILFAGTALQLFGILLVACGVRKVRKDFGAASIFTAKSGP
jgi:hypothetical protein